MWFFPVLFFGYVASIIASKLSVPSTILSMVWLLLFLATGFVYVPISKTILYAFLMWAGYCDASATTPPRRKNAPVLRSLLFLMYLAGMVFSRQFPLDQALSVPGVRYLILHSVTILSCNLLPHWFFFFSQKRFFNGSFFHISSNILVMLGKSSLYLYILQGIPLILYQNLSNKHLGAAIFCFSGCILFPLMIQYISRIPALSFLDYLFRPSRIFSRRSNE